MTEKHRTWWVGRIQCFYPSLDGDFCSSKLVTDVILYPTDLTELKTTLHQSYTTRETLLPIGVAY